MNEGIGTIPADVPLSPAYIDVWIVSTEVSAERIAELRERLSEEEAERVDRVRIPEKRREAIVSRGVLRELLGKALGLDARTLRLGVGAHGKPFLASERDARVRFNVSHTAGRVMVAMTLDHDLGADIEMIRGDRSHVEIARRFFTANEAAAIMDGAAEAQARHFFTCWCRKEAVLKATGLGIAAGLQSFEVPVGDLARPAVVERFDGTKREKWMIHEVAVEMPYAASVAVKVCEAVIRRRAC